MNCTYNHAKPVTAKFVTMLVVAKPDDLGRPGSLSETIRKSRSEAIASGEYVEAKDGNWVGLGDPVCGVHGKDIVRRNRTVPADMVEAAGGAETDLAKDYAKRLYEKQLDDAEAKRQRTEAEWAEYQKKVSAVEFTVREEPQRDGRDWVIYEKGTDRPVSRVTLSYDGGEPRFDVNSYGGNVGQGRGTEQWARLVSELLLTAIGYAQAKAMVAADA